MSTRAAKDLGPLMFPLPTKGELVAALVSTPDRTAADCRPEWF
ncbi:hypothetical protein ABZW30_40980 [Kitasatospora sp. NPDC004669]